MPWLWILEGGERWSRTDVEGEVPRDAYVMFSSSSHGPRGRLSDYFASVGRSIARMSEPPAEFSWLGEYHVGPGGDTFHCGHCAAVVAEECRTTVVCRFGPTVGRVAPRPGLAGRDRLIAYSEEDRPAEGDHEEEDEEAEVTETDAPCLPVGAAREHIGALRYCSRCSMPGHRSDTCALTAEEGAIYAQIGIEIEGRWRTQDWGAIGTAARRRGHVVTTDGSLESFSGYACAEIPTTPQNLRDSLDSLLEFYPHHTGRDCGMHVHVSFRDVTAIARLATPEFHAYFGSRWRAWHRSLVSQEAEFWRRLTGANTYCDVMQASLLTDPDFDPTRMDRYHQLNFSAWREHRTVECRLLPMFRDPLLGVMAIIELLSIYHDFLVAPHDVAAASVSMSEISTDAVDDQAILEFPALDPVDVQDTVAAEAFQQLDLDLQQRGFRRLFISALRGL